MKPTGIVRRIDDLGRIVVPQIVRQALNITEGEPLELFTMENGVCFVKYDPSETGKYPEENTNCNEKEFDFILEFIEGNEDLDEVIVMQQLRCLWTAFCLHQDYDVDTLPYDEKMLEIWNVMQEGYNSPYSSDEYERFYNAMSKYLV